jgi:holdfast attachment protein HfaA
MSKRLKMVCLAAVVSAFAATPSMAQVAGFNDAGSYNSGYGMSAGSAQQPVNASLRDGNGNLSVVNGEFQGSTMSQSTGVQNLRNIGQSSGVGFGNSSSGTATAMGNSLNVITTGSFNTVVVNSTQTNNGNQTATVTTNGH